MDNDMNVNVMSVNLAIQRELAYREKIAKLQTNRDDFMKSLLPLQVQSCSDSHSQNIGTMLPPRQISNPSPDSSTLRGSTQPPNCNQLTTPNTSFAPGPSHSGIKRKPSKGKVQYPPPRCPRPSPNTFVSIDQFGNFFCKVCEVSCSGALTLKQHLKGHKHKAKLQWLAMDKTSGEPKGTTTTTTCNICRIWCSDENALELHLKGQKHRAKVQELELGRGSAREGAVEQPSCELRGVWCSDESSFELHLRGLKHKAKAHESSREKGVERPFCEVCQIWCMNDDALQQHLKGQKHIARISDVRKKARGNGR